MKDRFQDYLLMKKDGSILILFLVIVLFTVPSSLNALEPKSNFQVEYVKNRLMINAHNIAFGSLLETIRRKTGIEFVIGPEQSERLISIQLEDLPLSEGLKRIFSNFNYAFLFGADNKLVKVIVLGYAGPDSSQQVKQSNINSSEFMRIEVPQSTVLMPSSRAMKIEPPLKQGGMVVTYSKERMVVEPPTGKGMIVEYMEESKSKAH